MNWHSAVRQPGVLAALAAALLFGAGTPLAKALLGDVSPWMLAALLYLGSGIGLAVFRRIALGMAAILAGAAVLSWPGTVWLARAGHPGRLSGLEHRHAHVHDAHRCRPSAVRLQTFIVLSETP